MLRKIIAKGIIVIFRPEGAGMPAADRIRQDDVSFEFRKIGEVREAMSI
jgi:hypothetical protein